MKTKKSTLKEIQNLQDSYTLLYGVIGKCLIDQLSDQGEVILREATRRYGADRGRYRRKRHIDANYKINMKSLFSVGSDLPADPRFFGYLEKLSPQRRTLFNLRCPMAELWIDKDMQYIGRLYCEEFHPACYKEYAYGYTTVNLSKTLTQEGDGYCAFNIILRPEHLPDDLKRLCFEEYDPEYTGPTKNLTRNEAKPGFNLLCVKVLYYIVQVLEEHLGEIKAEKIMKGCFEILAEHSIDFMSQAAKSENLEFNENFFSVNYPMNLDLLNDPVWEGYTDNSTQRLLLKYFVTKVYELFKKGSN